MRSERSSERHESNDSMDALIDDAARQLVAGAPSSSLRSTVLDRIGRRRSPWQFAPALAAAGALVIVAMLVGVNGPADVPRTLTGAPRKVQQPLAQPVPVERGSAGAPADDAAALTRSVRLQADQVQLTRRLAADDLVPPVEEEPPIPPIMIEPLTTIEPLSSVQIAVNTSSGVVPIEIAPLQIEPLLSE